jgi:putative peptide zinc metalloprotease protein
LIDGAGMTAEITLAVIATIVWAVLPDGPMRSGSYLLASSAWIITLAINLNPFMRFDGYYLLSDTLDIPNLQDRAFAYARWQLRESLFGFGFEPPELWPKNRQYILLVYAWGTWTYRLILFTGIAWAVYYFFFKALGLALFAVEIGWFIVRPVYNEIKTWRDLFEATKTPLRPRRSWLIPLALLLVLLIPWRSHFIVPGIVVAAVENTLYCIEPAQVKEVLIKEGDKVKANQILIKLDSPDLDYKILADELKIQELSEKLASQSLELKLARNNPVDFEELQKTQAELIGFRETKAKLTIIASINGRVRDLSDLVRPGEWIAKDEPLGIIENTRYSVIGYVEEADIGHLEVGGKGRFYPEGGDIKPFPVAIEKIDKVGTRELKVEELASIYGGEIAVREGEEKKLIPEQGIYRVTMVNEDALEEIHTTVRGRLSLTTQAESIAEKLWRFSVIALVRESGW